VLLSLATSLVLSRLDFGGSTLAGLPQHLLDSAQRRCTIDLIAAADDDDDAMF